MASDVITPGHSICIAIPATNPAMFGESPLLPDNFDVIDARLVPGFTSDGQIDWPIPAMVLLSDPLLPIPAPFSAVVIESLGVSACATAGNVAAAVMTPAATASGRSAAEAALMKSAHTVDWRTTEERRTVCVVDGRDIISAVMHSS